MNRPRDFQKTAAAGVAAAAASGALWAALMALTERELGFAAVGVGAGVAYAVRRASGVDLSPRVHRTAYACSLLGILLGKFFFVAHALRDLSENRPDRPPGFHVSYFDPRTFKFFALVFPHMLTFLDALWIALALGAVWLILGGARRIW